jgi:hypothetical protein
MCKEVVLLKIVLGFSLLVMPQRRKCCYCELKFFWSNVSYMWDYVYVYPFMHRILVSCDVNNLVYYEFYMVFLAILEGFEIFIMECVMCKSISVHALVMFIYGCTTS